MDGWMDGEGRGGERFGRGERWRRMSAWMHENVEMSEGWSGFFEVWCEEALGMEEVGKGEEEPG